MPIVCYRVVSEDNLRPLTPESNRMFQLIVQYCWPLFSSELNFKKYVLNHFCANGTQVFITHLRNPVAPSLSPELFSDESDDIRTKGPEDLEHSLTMSLHSLFLKQPENLEVHVNRQRVQLRNPYSSDQQQSGQIHR